MSKPFKLNIRVIVDCWWGHPAAFTRIIDGGVYTIVLGVQHLSHYRFSTIQIVWFWHLTFFKYWLTFQLGTKLGSSHGFFTFWSVISHCPGSYWKTWTSIQYCSDTFQLIHRKILLNYSFTMNEYLIISVKVVFLTVPHLSLQTSFHRQFEILPSCLLSKP